MQRNLSHCNNTNAMRQDKPGVTAIATAYIAKMAPATQRGIIHSGIDEEWGNEISSCLRIEEVL